MAYKEIRANEEVNALLDKENKNLGLIGFTDNSKAHCTYVAETAGHILKKCSYDAHDIELAKIAGNILQRKQGQILRFSYCPYSVFGHGNGSLSGLQPLVKQLGAELDHLGHRGRPIFGCRCNYRCF